MCLGAFCNFGTEAIGVSKKFPSIKPYLATLAGNFRMPVLRDYLMSGEICPVNRNTIDYILSKWNRKCCSGWRVCRVPGLPTGQKHHDPEAEKRICEGRINAWGRPCPSLFLWRK
ncbi:Diacylglycerol O-acyltransferase 2 [Pristimantis euphronides]